MKVVKWLLIMGSGLLVIGGLGAWLSFPDIQPETKQTVDVQKVYSLDGVQALRLTSEFGDLKIASTEDESAKLVIKGSAMVLENDFVKEEVVDRSIRLQLLSKGIRQTYLYTGLWGLVYDRLKYPGNWYTQLNTTLFIPENPDLHLVLHQKYGDVDVHTLNINKLTVQNEFGDTTVHDSSAEMELKSENGDIHLNYSETPENVFISGLSEFGDVTIFGEKQQSQRFGNGETKVYLETQDGDIEVNK